MPLHWTRKWSRGFNQAELLARVVSKHTALPVLSVLLRKRSTKAQAGLSDAERRANLDGAFQVPIPLRSKIAGKHILLIDDVLTTGTTLSAASRTLRRAGASRITVLTVARADRRSHWSLLDHVENNPAEFNQFHEVDPTESTEHGEGTLRS